ncbi:MAG TPA: phosphoglycerate mutase family protein [Vicinamibacterales bacterium]|nr:phosphoglycerate mutase family protein [Vicinamibacterales bacterium]
MTQRTRQGLWFAVLALVLAMPAAARAQETVIFVRHAERADGGAGARTGAMSAAPADPLLSAAGQARAQKLATVLRDANIKAIYATEFHRTQDTAKPLASKLRLDVQAIPARDTAALVVSIKAAHAKDVVLVVGHSNTLPDAIKAFGGPAVTIGDDEYDAIFVLNPVTGTLTLIRY